MPAEQRKRDDAGMEPWSPKEDEQSITKRMEIMPIAVQTKEKQQYQKKKTEQMRDCLACDSLRGVYCASVTRWTTTTTT